MGTTSDRGYPYPESTDRVTDGWDAIRDLAEAVDDDVKDTREPPYASAEGTTDYTHNGGVTFVILSQLGALTEVEEGVTHAAGVFTVPESGVYELLGYVRQNPVTAPHNGVQIWFGFNGNAAREPMAYAGDGHLGNSQTLCVQDRVRLAANDTVALVGQGIGGQTSVQFGRISVLKVRD